MKTPTDFIIEVGIYSELTGEQLSKLKQAFWDFAKQNITPFGSGATYNKCNECGKELSSGTVFCSADCRIHYYSDK